MTFVFRRVSGTGLAIQRRYQLYNGESHSYAQILIVDSPENNKYVAKPSSWLFKFSLRAKDFLFRRVSGTGLAVLLSDQLYNCESHSYAQILIGDLPENKPSNWLFKFSLRA